MQKDSIIALQKIDCNCNDCIFMIRDLEKRKSFDIQYLINGIATDPSWRPAYGNCSKFNKPVSFLPNTIQIDTQECFKHRRA